MYDSPPPKDSLNWSFGLMLDVCLRLGLGNTDTGVASWTEKRITEELKLGSIRSWKTGGGIKADNLNLLTNVLTDGEKYQEAWSLVIRNSAQNLQPTENVRLERKQYFGVEKFTLKNHREAVSRYMESTVAITFDEIEMELKAKRPKPGIINTATLQGEHKPSNYSRRLWSRTSPHALKISLSAGLLILLFLLPLLHNTYFNSSLSSSTYADINYKGVIFNNIQFCKEENFDHDLNICLAQSNNFEFGIEKINISFESTKIREGGVLNLRWYRYGEKFIETEKNWTDAFALSLKYASTFIASPIDTQPFGKGIAKGRYHVRFYIKDNLIDEASFTVQ